MKSQKGITLIALVITIIVMLILVAVTVTMAIQGGLFEKAGEATQKTNEAIEAENQLGSGLVNVQGTSEKDLSNIANYYVNGRTY